MKNDWLVAYGNGERFFFIGDCERDTTRYQQRRSLISKRLLVQPFAKPEQITYSKADVTTAARFLTQPNQTTGTVSSYNLKLRTSERTVTLFNRHIHAQDSSCFRERVASQLVPTKKKTPGSETLMGIRREVQTHSQSWRTIYPSRLQQRAHAGQENTAFPLNCFSR